MRSGMPSLNFFFVLSDLFTKCSVAIVKWKHVLNHLIQSAVIVTFFLLYKCLLEYWIMIHFYNFLPDDLYYSLRIFLLFFKQLGHGRWNHSNIGDVSTPYFGKFFAISKIMRQRSVWLRSCSKVTTHYDFWLLQGLLDPCIESFGIFH